MFFIGFLFVGSSLALMFSASFVQNMSFPCGEWSAFLDNVSTTPGAYRRVTIGGSAKSAGDSCDDSAFVDALATAMRSRSSFERTCPSDGSVWRAAQCSVTREVVGGSLSHQNCAFTTRVASTIECWGCVTGLHWRRAAVH